MEIFLKQFPEIGSTSIFQLLHQQPPNNLVFPNVHLFLFLEEIKKIIKVIGPSVRKNEVIAYPVKNHSTYIAGLIALLTLKANILLLDSTSPQKEQKKLKEKARSTRTFLIETLNFHTDDKTCAASKNDFLEGGHILLPTSGSTGEPKLVARSEQSWIQEAERYQEKLHINENDYVLIPLPITHAYALGWLFANLLSKATTELTEPQHLNHITYALFEQATIVVLTPNLANLLSLRPLPNPYQQMKPKKIRFIMVGAGPVTKKMEEAFKNKMGVSLARNYGSTETGATFAGLPPQLPYSIGSPMSNIDFKIEKICPEETSGLLKIRIGQGEWINTGDRAEQDKQGHVIITGRETQSIRRGDRWVSPQEIEEAILNILGIKDAYVYKLEEISSTGNEHIIAEVVPENIFIFSYDKFYNTLSEILPPYKIPDKIIVKEFIEKTEQGKPKRKPCYQLPDRFTFMKHLMAYKRSEIIFSLYETGILDQLNGHTNPIQIAINLGLDVNAVEELLNTAEKLGIITAKPAHENNNMQPFIRLESLLSKSYSCRDYIEDVLKKGIIGRKFEKQEINNDFLNAYQEAMHGDASQARVLHGYRKIKSLLPCTILEITVSHGTYSAIISKSNPRSKNYLLRIGKLSASSSSEDKVIPITELDGKTFDLIIINNAIHYPVLHCDIHYLLSHLSKKGVLFIDDIFLSEEDSFPEITIDWLTHGGIRLKTLKEVKNYCHYSTPHIMAVPGYKLHYFIIIPRGNDHE